ncbi:unnamed protein product [Camellia sinensis]
MDQRSSLNNKRSWPLPPTLSTLARLSKLEPQLTNSTCSSTSQPYYPFSTRATISYLFHHAHEIPIFSWCLVTNSELMFTSIWIITQAFRWWPVTRTIHPENLPGNTDLPGIDVFICTANPKKEPTVEVMNTVLSAVVLDYPLEKLAMYLSDDDGWPLTLYGLKEACLFGRSWIPFCRKYGIKTPSPERYFSSFGDDDRVLRNHEFMAEEEDIKEGLWSKYEVFKKNVEKFSGCSGTEDFMVHDRPPHVEPMNFWDYEQCGFSFLLGSIYLNLSQVARATQNFSPLMKIGEGGFGAVYKALLPGAGMAKYQMPLFREIDRCLKAKCDKLADAFEIDDIDTSSGNQSSSARLPERVKF